MFTFFYTWVLLQIDQLCYGYQINCQATLIYNVAIRSRLLHSRIRYSSVTKTFLWNFYVVEENSNPIFSNIPLVQIFKNRLESLQKDAWCIHTGNLLLL